MATGGFIQSHCTATSAAPCGGVRWRLEQTRCHTLKWGSLPQGKRVRGSGDGNLFFWSCLIHREAHISWKLLHPYLTLMNVSVRLKLTGREHWHSSPCPQICSEASLWLGQQEWLVGSRQRRKGAQILEFRRESGHRMVISRRAVNKSWSVLQKENWDHWEKFYCLGLESWNQ